MKKTVLEAVENAKLHSKMNPNNDVWVMGKKKKHAVICANEWVRKQRIMSGWRVVKTFRNGKEVYQ